MRMTCLTGGDGHFKPVDDPMLKSGNHAKTALFSCAISLAMTCNLSVFPAAAQSAGAAATATQPVAAGVVRCYATTHQENLLGADHSNQIRAQQGLSRLTPNAQLAKAAAQHACDMAQRSKMTHVGSKMARPSQRVRAAGYRQRIVAENIGMGFDSTEQVTQAWRASQSHLTNILLPQVQEFGIGRAVAADGRTVFWAAVYAAKR